MVRRLPQHVQDQVDAELRQRRILPAILLVREQGMIDPKPGLREAQDMVAARMARLVEQGLVEPEPRPDPRQITATIATITEPIAAIEATWDGDTQGWFVLLLAIVRRPSRHHPQFDEIHLAAFRQGTDLRLFNGTVPPWPEAADATTMGTSIAANLGVPFHFTNLDSPDVDPPRWWDQS